MTDETGDAGASLPDVTALVFASVSSDDFRQVGLGPDSDASRLIGSRSRSQNEDPEACFSCWTERELGWTVVGRRLGGLLPMSDAVGLGGVADGCCRMSMFS
ncbi:MAG: hypothetical protein K1W02_12685 [Muribaculaceae bacterium]